MYVYVFIYIHVYVYMCIYVYMCTYVYICVYVYICEYLDTLGIEYEEEDTCMSYEYTLILRHTSYLRD